MIDIKHQLNHLQRSIIDAAQQCARDPANIRLIAVSKTRSIIEIQQAISAGQRDFGENYIQEAVEKIQTIDNQKLCWHFIGPIQANKTKAIAENFDWVHSVDRLKIAERLNNQRPLQLPPLNICLQVNISGESSKSGVAPDDVLALATHLKSLKKLNLRGLMTIPQATFDKSKQQKQFNRMRILFDQCRMEGLQLDSLSMGMSSDYPAAIAEGATMIRIGTAIFGPRT